MYALVKDIYRLAEASAGMKRMDGSSRKGLSPLLAIIIGLIVTIVAGILLAQLYFSYAATISARPAANIEYVDLVADGTDRLVINIKNTGNVPINGYTLPGGAGACIANPDPSTNPIPPGGVGSIVCTGDFATPGAVWSGTLGVSFSDGSTQTYAISVRARR